MMKLDSRGRMELDLEKKRIVDLGMMKIVDLVEVKNKHSYLAEFLPSHSVAVSYFPFYK